MTDAQPRTPAIEHQRRDFQRHQADLRRGGGAAAWSAKHGGACPQCGSRNGMRWHIADGFEAQPGEAVYRQPGNEGTVFTACPYCETDTMGYERI